MRQEWQRPTAEVGLDNDAVAELVRPALPDTPVTGFEMVVGGLANSNVKVLIAGPPHRVLLRLYQLIRSTEDITRVIDPTRFHYVIAPVYETVQRVAEALPSEVTLIGYAGAPWTVATYMVEGRGGAASDHAHIRRWAFSDPDGFQQLIDILTGVTIEYLSRQILAGAEVVQLFDSWAGILPEPFFRRWCAAPVATIVGAVKARHPDVPIIAFPRGAGLLYQGYAEATGADAIGLDSGVPLQWAAETVQQGLGRCVQGNLDPQMLVIGGPRMSDEAMRILNSLSGGPCWNAYGKQQGKGKRSGSRRS